MRARKRRRTAAMRSDNGEGGGLPQPDGVLALHDDRDHLCHHGVCAVRRGGHAPAPAKRPQPPHSFNPGDCGKNLRCADERRLTVVYDGPDDTDKNASSVRATAPVPAKGAALFYFEVRIEDCGSSGNVGIGLCTRTVKLEKMPGWEPGSFGYHGDDGLLFKQSGQSGNKYGPKYTTGDVVGCCVDFVEQPHVFFTKNGESLGRAFDLTPGSWYPTVGMQTKGGRLTANFGHAPFAFRIEDYARAQRERILAAIRARPPPADYRALEATVLGYLIHNGFAETASAFARDSGRTDTLDAEHTAMLQRREVCRLVVDGDIDGALSSLRDNFPSVLDGATAVAFLLHTQKFIEMIVGGAHPEETVAYGKAHLGAYQHSADRRYAEQLEEVYSLLAYVAPKTSPHGHLTQQSRRNLVAEKLNAAILKSQGRATKSALERIVCHAELLLAETLKEGNGSVALVSVEDFL